LSFKTVDIDAISIIPRRGLLVVKWIIFGFSLSFPSNNEDPILKAMTLTPNKSDILQAINPPNE
jgi:hypothetical protein